MNPLTPEVVRNFLLKKFEPVLLDHGMALDKVPADFDLFAEGIIDSMGVLNMISDVEAEFGITLDMEKMDAEQLTILSAFSKYVAENSAASPVAANGKAVEMNELNADGIRSDLRNFIRRSYSIAENDQDFTDDVHLYNAGYIDPMGSAGLKSFVESKFAIRVNDMDLSKYSMNTIRELSEFVMKRRKGEI